MACCVGIYDIWPEAQYYLSHLIPKPGEGYSLATIIGAILGSVLFITVIAGLILITAQVNPVVPVCPCPVLDYGLLAYSTPAGFETNFHPALNTWLLFGGTNARTVFTSSTSNTAKFNVLGGLSSHFQMQYFPVYNSGRVLLSGTASASFNAVPSDGVSKITMLFAVAWSADNQTTYTNLTQGSIDITSPTPQSGTVTLPFALNLTPSMVPLGNIFIGLQYNLSTAAPPPNPVTLIIHGVSVLATEV